ncbi:MAG: 1,4-alpha-glucan branching enzyme, partial [Pseudomonadota bacterium]
MEITEVNTTETESPRTLSEDLLRVSEARHHDPFSVLGRHSDGAQECVRAFLPHAQWARIGKDGPRLERLGDSDFFEWCGTPGTARGHYRLHWEDSHGHERSACDPYTFPPQLAGFDLHLFGEGKHWHIYRVLGAHPHEADGIPGVLFATWAPSAERVSVVGDFNRWDGRQHPMRVRGGSGVWELFIPELEPGTLYKFEIRNRESGELGVKSDPYGQQFEKRPKTASIVAADSEYVWQDQGWMAGRAETDWLRAPISIYEAHPGSWQRDEQGEFLDYHELASRMVAYCQEMGFTHIELLPITEH